MCTLVGLSECRNLHGVIPPSGKNGNFVSVTPLRGHWPILRVKTLTRPQNSERTKQIRSFEFIFSLLRRLYIALTPNHIRVMTCLPSIYALRTTYNNVLQRHNHNPSDPLWAKAFDYAVMALAEVQTTLPPAPLGGLSFTSSPPLPIASRPQPTLPPVPTESPLPITLIDVAQRRKCPLFVSGLPFPGEVTITILSPPSTSGENIDVTRHMVPAEVSRVHTIKGRVDGTHEAKLALNPIYCTRKLQKMYACTSRSCHYIVNIVLYPDPHTGVSPITHTWKKRLLVVSRSGLNLRSAYREIRVEWGVDTDDASNCGRKRKSQVEGTSPTQGEKRQRTDPSLQPPTPPFTEEEGDTEDEHRHPTPPAPDQGKGDTVGAQLSGGKGEMRTTTPIDLRSNRALLSPLPGSPNPNPLVAPEFAIQILLIRLPERQKLRFDQPLPSGVDIMVALKNTYLPEPIRVACSVVDAEGKHACRTKGPRRVDMDPKETSGILLFTIEKGDTEIYLQVTGSRLPLATDGHLYVGRYMLKVKGGSD